MFAANEIAVLKAIYHNDFQDGCKGEETIGNQIWSDCIDCNEVSGKALSAVVASLSKKGAITADRQGKDACVSLTRLGYEAIMGEGA